MIPIKMNVYKKNCRQVMRSPVHLSMAQMTSSPFQWRRLRPNRQFFFWIHARPCGDSKWIPIISGSQNHFIHELIFKIGIVIILIWFGCHWILERLIFWSRTKVFFIENCNRSKFLNLLTHNLFFFIFISFNLQFKVILTGINDESWLCLQ